MTRATRTPATATAGILTASLFFLGPIVAGTNRSSATPPRATTSGPVKILALYDVEGEKSHDNFGSSISRMPDLDGDGVAEILVGAPNRNPDYSTEGHAYLLSGVDGAILRKHAGTNYGDRFGHAVSILGDVNGDGVAEYAVGAIWAVADQHASPIEKPGSVTIYDGFDGSQVKIQSGVAKYECHGSAIARLNDVNGDGIDDFAVGVRFGGAIGGEAMTAPGAVRVFSGFDDTLISQASGAFAADFLGFRVIAIPDIDGDGVLDIASGAYNFPAGGAKGQVRLLSGATGATLRTIAGERMGDHFGWSLAVVPDLDGDGIDDLAVGAASAHGAAGAVTLVSLATGVKQMTILGSAPNGEFGYSIATVGDVNGDGHREIVVGSPFYGSSRGRVQVVSIVNGEVLATLDGKGVGDHFGECLANVGDVNGDGNDDLAIGAIGAPNDSYHGNLTVATIR